MKNDTFFKRALITLTALLFVLNCTSQTPKEKWTERNELRKSEKTRSHEKLGTLIHSRNFIFKCGGTENGQIPPVIVMINGPAFRISGLYNSEWSKTTDGSELIYTMAEPTSGKINAWELTENSEEPAYLISFIAHSDNSDTGVLIKIFSDKTAIAQFGGRQFRGRVTPN